MDTINDINDNNSSSVIDVNIDMKNYIIPNYLLQKIQTKSITDKNLDTLKDIHTLDIRGCYNINNKELKT